MAKVTRTPVLDSPGTRVLLLGNQAIARGALEAGCRFAAGYPGTPSSEVLETLAASAEVSGLYAEWSTNEKVAFENAVGMSLCGLRAIVTMKHAGMNVMSDPLSLVCLSGVRGGLVILAADDPACHSSANEQDSRFYAMFAKTIALEPSDPQEAKDMTRDAFALSERIELPVIVRSVTRVSHARGNVVLGDLPSERRSAAFTRDKDRFWISGKRALARHIWLIERQNLVREAADDLSYNWLWEPEEPTDALVVASGIGYAFAKEAFEDLGLGATKALLKLGSSVPLPEALVRRAVLGKKIIYVIEEGEPFVERQLRSLLLDLPEIPVVKGKLTGDLKYGGELDGDVVADGLDRVFGTRMGGRAGAFHGASNGDHGAPSAELVAEISAILPERSMAFCSGCPHSATSYTLMEALRKMDPAPLVCGDIGCYILISSPPYDLGDVKYCMGASIAVASGMARALGQKTVAIIGDGTFLHAGIPALINAVYNQADITLVLVDNCTTGMTGAQPHAGTGVTAMGSMSRAIRLEGLITECGVTTVEVADAYSLEQLKGALGRALAQPGVSVVIARRECAIEMARSARAEGRKLVPYQVTAKKCTKCWVCLKRFSCPSLYKDGPVAAIDTATCVACGVCMELCPDGAIATVDG